MSMAFGYSPPPPAQNNQTPAVPLPQAAAVDPMAPLTQGASALQNALVQRAMRQPGSTAVNPVSALGTPGATPNPSYGAMLKQGLGSLFGAGTPATPPVIPPAYGGS